MGATSCPAKRSTLRRAFLLVGLAGLISTPFVVSEYGHFVKHIGTCRD